MKQIVPEVDLERRLVISVKAKGKTTLRRSFPVGFPVRIGRLNDCHICLPILAVSRCHATLTLSEQGLELVESSSQGTRVGSELVRGVTALFQTNSLELHIGGYQLDCRVEEREHGAPDIRRAIHQKLIERLDLARTPRGQQVTDELRKDVLDVLEQLVLEERVPLHLRAKIVRDVADEALGLGPLETLLSDPNVSEIMVVDPNVIYVERDGRLELTGRSFSDADAVRAVIERIVTPLGRRIDEASPLVDARLPDGSRVNAVIPPLALRGPCITIRKFRAGALELKDLIERESLSRDMARFLEAAVRVRKNIVISGGTGSGKTTLLNILSAAIPRGERIVTIEDAAELSLKQSHVVSLESRPPNLEGKGEYTIRDLVKNALRMRPDRIVVGECRGGEALDMLQAMNTGHEGSMTTTHANSPREAVGRLETLCLMSGVELPLVAIRRQIAGSVHLIVQQSRLADGSRKVTSIAEVVEVDERGEVVVRELYSYQVEGTGPDGRIVGKFIATGYLPSFLAELEKVGNAC